MRCGPNSLAPHSGPVTVGVQRTTLSLESLDDARAPVHECRQRRGGLCCEGSTAPQRKDTCVDSVDCDSCCGWVDPSALKLTLRTMDLATRGRQECSRTRRRSGRRPRRRSLSSTCGTCTGVPRRRRALPSSRRRCRRESPPRANVSHRRGVTILWAPSDVTSAYKDSQARLNLLALPTQRRCRPRTRLTCRSSRSTRARRRTGATSGAISRRCLA